MPNSPSLRNATAYVNRINLYKRFKQSITLCRMIRISCCLKEKAKTKENDLEFEEFDWKVTKN